MRRSAPVLIFSAALLTGGQAIAQQRYIPETPLRPGSAVNIQDIHFQHIGPGRMADSDLGGPVETYWETEAQASVLRQRIDAGEQSGRISPAAAAHARSLWDGAWNNLKSRRTDAVRASLAFVRISNWLEHGQL